MMAIGAVGAPLGVPRPGSRRFPRARTTVERRRLTAGAPSAHRSNAHARPVVEPVVTVRDAEPGFVDADENLEPGESLVRAVKAFDADGTLLAAGALVRTRTTEVGARRTSREKEDDGGDVDGGSADADASDEEGDGVDAFDVWLGDSVSPRASANLQERAARVILDALVLQLVHVPRRRHARWPGTQPALRVHAPGGTASLNAARSRGFIDDGGDAYGDGLRWDAESTPSAYAAVAAAGERGEGGMDHREVRMARAILRSLEAAGGARAGAFQAGDGAGETRIRVGTSA